jgi:hypothetical protein
MEFVWNLVLGAWCLVFGICLEFGAWYLEFYRKCAGQNGKWEKFFALRANIPEFISFSFFPF